MTGSDWIDFFKGIPDKEHELIMISLKNGAEVAFQRIMKYLDKLMIVRGRLGGTDDADRVFCIPYDHIDMVFFTRPQDDHVVQAIFGEIIGGVRRAYLTDDEEEAEKELAAEAVNSVNPDVSTEGAIPVTDKPPPLNVSALRSRLLQKSKRVDPRTRKL